MEAFLTALSLIRDFTAHGLPVPALVWTSLFLSLLSIFGLR